MAIAVDNAYNKLFPVSYTTQIQSRSVSEKTPLTL